MTRWYVHRFHTVAALRLVFFTMRWTPKWVQAPLAMGTALIFYFMLRKERQAVERNLHRVTGRKGMALHWRVYRVFYSFCDLMVSYCFIPQANDVELLEMLAVPERGAAVIDRCLAEGHGLIVWTAHLGNPEVASRLLELHGRPVNVARVVEDRPAERILRERMSNPRLRIVNLKQGALATIELLQALRRNEIVAIQGDRVYHERHSARLPFFSAEAAFPLGPFLLAEVAGAPLLPGFVVRQGWQHYRVLLGEPIMTATTGNHEEDQRAALNKAVSFLEAQLKNYDDQWVNFFDFWPDHARD
jgi:KDO2-lipid IV(A) lauroyltransferase